VYCILDWRQIQGAFELPLETTGKNSNFCFMGRTASSSCLVCVDLMENNVFPVSHLVLLVHLHTPHFYVSVQLASVNYYNIVLRKIPAEIQQCSICRWGWEVVCFWVVRAFAVVLRLPHAAG